MGCLFCRRVRWSEGFHSMLASSDWRSELKKSKLLSLTAMAQYHVLLLRQVHRFIHFLYFCRVLVPFIIRHAFSALTLSVGHQEENLASKSWVMRCWCGYLSGARCRLFAWSSWCHCRPKTPSSRAPFKSRLVLPFWYRLTQVVLEKTPLNLCSSSNSGSSGSSIIRHACSFGWFSTWYV